MDWFFNFADACWNFFKKIFWLVAILGFIFALIIGLSLPEVIAARACEAEGGHFVDQPFIADECWSRDGTRRIFPKGF